MKRSKKKNIIKDFEQFKQKLLHWAQDQQTLIWLDSNGHQDPYGSFDALLAIGEASSLVCEKTDNAFDQLAAYQSKVQDWIFGYFSYDLKNDLENLVSKNSDQLHFPALYFFQPQKIFLLRGNTLEQHYLAEFKDQIYIDLKAIVNRSFSPKNGANNLKIDAHLNKVQYIEQVKKMLYHIHRGDIYEANFCQEFYADGKMDALQTFEKFNSISLAPFAAYFKSAEKHLLCTSPERYLCKRAEKIISQPIKGTARRSENPFEDAQIAAVLQNNEKERTENIMITDLVRNDLSRLAQKGSVHVDELCGIYSFKQVHQLVSTISATVDPKIPVIELIKKTFPMGSMTGAPKVSAMKIIEDLEQHKRGVYSGALGYFTPDGDFDFNVVIRSILYDSAQEKISFSVGSAITALSEPEMEYKECMLKAKAMLEVLSK